MKLLTWLRRWWVASLGVVVVALVTLGVSLYSSWDSVWWWLEELESASATIRNVCLVIGAFAALGLTVRRIKVADRQARTAQQGLLYDRYQKGAEMLGGALLAVRLGGIYALHQLAKENPEQSLRPTGPLCAGSRRTDPRPPGPRPTGSL